MPQAIREAGSPGQGITNRDGRTATITIITPGTGSSGIYPAAVLEQAAQDRVFAAGAHMFMDHADAQKDADYPVGKVGDLAGVLIEDAVWTGSALEAKARIFDAYADELTDKQDAIGVSIRAYAEHEQKPGDAVPTITRITEAISIDFVTRAGRGGSFRIEESVRRAIASGVSEDTANETQRALSAAIRAAYADADGQYAWLHDYDETVAWFEWESAGNTGIYQVAYSLTDGEAVLSGEPVEVRRNITYVPVTAGQSESEITKPKESNMPEISEQELSALRESAATADAVTQERDRLKQEAADSKAEAAEARTKANEATAKRVVGEAFKNITAPALIEQLAATYPTSEDGVIDEAAFTSKVEEAVAELAEAGGAGKVNSFGKSAAESEDMSSAEYFRALGINVKEA